MVKSRCVFFLCLIGSSSEHIRNDLESLLGSFPHAVCWHGATVASLQSFVERPDAAFGAARLRVRGKRGAVEIGSERG
jgi:hypothetical protein